MNTLNSFAFGYSNLNEILQEVDKIMDERYVFPDEEDVWGPEYWNVSKSDDKSKCIYPNGIVPMKTRLFRTMFITNEAHRTMIERRYMMDIDMGTHRPMTPWGVISAAITMTTYNAILNHDKGELWSQAKLRDNLGIVPRYISDRSFRQQLRDNTNPNYAENFYRRVNMIDGDDASPELYYLNSGGRRGFTRLCLMKRAVLIAGVLLQNTVIAERLVYQWKEKFDHPMSVIQCAMEAHPWPNHSSYRDAVLESGGDDEDAGEMFDSHYSVDNLHTLYQT